MMQRGGAFERHSDHSQVETLCILEGVVLDEAGCHDPQATQTGVTSLAILTGRFDLSDFELSLNVE
jgi:hypothetical protein